MRYGEGLRALYSRHGKDLLNMLEPFKKWHQIKTDLSVGDILFNGCNKKTDQKFYVVKQIEKIKEEKKSRIHLILKRLTPTGREGNGSLRLNIWENNDHLVLGYSFYRVVTSYEKAIKAFNVYKENTKNRVSTGKERDYQKRKVYKSEWYVPKEIRETIISDGSEENIQKYIDGVINDPEIRKINPDVSIRNIEFKLNNRRKGGISLNYKRKVIECANSKFGKSKLTILHEIAHFYAPKTMHGKTFTTMFLRILKIKFPEAYIEVKRNYDKYGVDYTQ